YRASRIYRRQVISACSSVMRILKAMKKRTVSLSCIKLLVALALVLAAAVSTQKVVKADKAKIVYYSMFSEGEPLQQVLKKATDDFMTENPDIEVESVWAGRQNLTQLQSVLAAGDQVDIVDHSDDRVYNAIVVPGLGLPLDNYLDSKAYKSDKAWKD